MAGECKQCRHYNHCQSTGQLCYFAEQIANGNARTREPIASPDRLQYLPQSDYNDECYRLMRDREARDIERLEAIRAVPDVTRRAILAMALCDISQRQIAQLCNHSQAAISVIYRGHR